MSVGVCECGGCRRILVVKLSSLGDLFHALPAVHDLRTCLGTTIDWVVQRPYVGLVECFDDVARVIAFDRHRFLRSVPGLWRALRRERYDMVVDMQGLLKSAMLTRLARAARRIGPSFHREGTRLCYSEIAGVRDKARHAVEENLDVVRHLGFEPGPPAFPVSFPEPAIDAPRPRVGIVPLSRWETKNWPATSFAALGRRLQAGGATLFLFGGPADRDVCAEIAAALKANVVNLAGETGLPETGGYLQAMDLVVTNDSGPMHMAAAAGTPTLALFGPTDPVRTGPYGDRHRVIRAELPCGEPCYSRECRREGGVCLEGVTPERVADEALEMLAEKGCV